MANKVIVPHFGTSVEQVKLIRWIVEEGQEVGIGDVLCEIETDKATLDIESFYEGFLLKQMAEEEQDLEVGDIIGFIGKQGEQVEDLISSKPQQDEAIEIKEEVEPVSDASSKTKSEPVKINSEILATPKVRKYAREKNVSLAQIRPTGSNGQITIKDIDSCVQGPFEDAEIALSKNQQSVIKTISKSYSEIIPINLSVKINIERMVKLKEEKSKKSIKISYDSMIAYALSRSIINFPEFMCYYSNDKMINIGKCNIGLAMSSADELFIPVIQEADKKSLDEIATEVQQYAQKVKSKSVSSSEMSNAVFTISNLGMFPVQSFNVIIPPSQSGAVSIGTIDNVLELTDNGIANSRYINLMFSVDHRIINGRKAGEFIKEFKYIIENLI